MMGFEPTTPGITIRCSNQLSYTHQSWTAWRFNSKYRHFIAAARDGAFYFSLNPEWNLAWRARQESNLQPPA